MSAAEKITGKVPAATYEVVRRDGRAVLKLAGRWTVFTIGGLEHGLEHLSPKERVEAIDISQVDDLDTIGAGEVLHVSRRLAAKGDTLPIDGAKDSHAHLIELVARQKIKPEARTHVPWLVAQLSLIGVRSIEYARQIGLLMGFLGQTMVVGFSVLRSPRHLRFTAIVNLMEEVWVRALPIVGTLVFLIGVVLAYQGVEQLRRFGAQAFTVDMVGLSVLREIGVLLTAIIVAGRSGSAFTAQIGTMKVNLEVDAMSTMGLNPIEVLVLPRIFALVITMPLLVFFADIMGLLGGALACWLFLDFTLAQYFDRLQDVVDIRHFWVGMIKAPVFAAVVAIVGCYEGLQVTGSAESVGKLTTKSVVEAIFLVIILDAAFSIMFVSIGI